MKNCRQKTNVLSGVRDNPLGSGGMISCPKSIVGARWSVLEIFMRLRGSDHLGLTPVVLEMISSPKSIADKKRGKMEAVSFLEFYATRTKRPAVSITMTSQSLTLDDNANSQVQVKRHPKREMRKKRRGESWTLTSSRYPIHMMGPFLDKRMLFS
ncbi:hypothetical protein CEXT_9861 [Caerostris extrusa]|uniref:Uncharacterized protein n=1 Tax=Caerostris extrusa TaxID=172846 RepID=A0AAV4VCL3_CAEEX|nr:hypothetical protein CEXT_9861 [Caerostris extrusa]